MFDKSILSNYSRILFLEFQSSRLKNFIIQERQFWVIEAIDKFADKYFKNMEISTQITIPSSVRHMKNLDRDAFTQKIVVPSLLVKKLDLNQILSKKNLKHKYLLKIPKLNPIMDFARESKKQILLSPSEIKSDVDAARLLNENDLVIDYAYNTTELTLTYDNWPAPQILKAILPEEDGVSGFSLVGHILHLNLKEHLLPYKYIIADVLLDKGPTVTLVVNKIDSIDNTYRSFQMEKLAGEGDMITTAVEHGVKYTLDFSKVYWNPRLSDEHNRIVKKIDKGDVMYDVMSGVGPFSIPAAKKKCIVLANDLNPASFEYLEKNVKTNSVSDLVECYNMDGNAFIKTTVKNHLSKLYKGEFEGNIHIPMNLPAIAVTFLPSFIGLLSEELSSEGVNNCDILKGKNLPIVHVYMFSHNETREYAMHMVASQLGYTLNKLRIEGNMVKELDKSEVLDDIVPSFIEHVTEVVNVRRVSPSKIMSRVSFSLPAQILLKPSKDFHQAKKIKIS